MDCKDNSDENFCQNVEYHGKSYYTHIPPQEGTNERTKIGVGITIFSLSKIDQLEMKFTASIAVIIKWRDSRLFFRSQSFTFLMTNLCQDINRVSSFSRCLNGTFP